MNINIESKGDCELLIDRIYRTLASVNPDTVNKIPKEAPLFREDNRYIFEGLCRAIFSTRADWDSFDAHSDEVRRSLFNYEISEVAKLSDDDIRRKYETEIKPLSIAASSLEKDLRYLRDNAKEVFSRPQAYSSIGELIKGFFDQR